ncbi:MAG TPA: M15 family peptidase, partial [Streptosporangiaceae bacterium]
MRHRVAAVLMVALGLAGCSSPARHAGAAGSPPSAAPATRPSLAAPAARPGPDPGTAAALVRI